MSFISIAFKVLFIAIDVTPIHTYYLPKFNKGGKLHFLLPCAIQSLSLSCKQVLFVLSPTKNKQKIKQNQALCCGSVFKNQTKPAPSCSPGAGSGACPSPRAITSITLGFINSLKNLFPCSFSSCPTDAPTASQGEGSGVFLEFCNATDFQHVWDGGKQAGQRKLCCLQPSAFWK